LGKDSVIAVDGLIMSIGVVSGPVTNTKVLFMMTGSSGYVAKTRGKAALVTGNCTVTRCGTSDKTRYR